MDRMVARAEITECLYRYARGVDRHDREVLLSAYHPDATHVRGSFSGDPAAYAEWLFERLNRQATSHQHCVLNTLVDFDDDASAHAETYFLIVTLTKRGMVEHSVGRYIDRFECRDGVWRIAARTAIGIIRSEAPHIAEGADITTDPGRWDRSDLSYQRPFELTLAASSPETTE